MTFSICATVDGRHGVAIASHAVAVGSTASHVCRAGAVCTQATTSTPLGIHATRALERGTPADKAIQALVAADDRAPIRQLHAIDADAVGAAHTGADCVEWAGHRVGERCTAAGNMLEGPDVLEAMLESFESSTELPLDSRLRRALRAGEDAGGDNRGPRARSSALAVFDPDTPRLHHDLRVDEHEDAVTELERLHDVVGERGDTLVEAYPGFDPQRHPE